MGMREEEEKKKTDLENELSEISLSVYSLHFDRSTTPRVCATRILHSAHGGRLQPFIKSLK